VLKPSLLLLGLLSFPIAQGSDPNLDDPFHFNNPLSRIPSLKTQDGGSNTDPFFLRDPLALVRPANLNQVQTRADVSIGSLSSQVLLPDAGTNTANWVDPMRKWEWKREDNLKINVTGPLSLYGQMNAGSGEVFTKDTQLGGKAGLSCKVPVMIGEVQMSSGPSWSCSDPLRPMQTRERSEWQMELQARCPLIWGLGVEYKGQALPALSPLDRDRFNQDIHLAVPICQGGKLNLGAKQSCEAINGQPIQASDNSQIYLGIQLNR